MSTPDPLAPEPFAPDPFADAMVEPIAIIGMAVTVPGADSLDRFWQNLAAGVESVRFYSDAEQLALGVPAERLANPNFVRAAAPIEDVDRFDAAFFGMTPREAEVRDPQQRLFLELAHTALEDAGYDPARHPGEIGVYGGTGPDEYQWKNVRRNPDVVASAGHFAVATGNHSSYLSTFTSYKLDLRGPSLTVQTACSTSLVALHLACEALRNRECDAALAGAAAIELPHGQGYEYFEGGIMSPDGHCRAFDADAAGTLWASGGGVVVVKRLADALADGDTVRAVIRGNAINNDGSDKVGFSAPSIAGQTAVVAQALGLAGVDPRTIGYVEAHGTGTALGDPIEVAALSAAFGAAGTDTQWCALGSVKTNVGHLSAASGVAGLIKVVLAMEHDLLPANLHFRAPNPAIDFAATPFYVNAEAGPWPDTGGPRRAGISSFGVGGTNAHFVLEEPPARPAAPTRSRRAELLQLSARTPAALDALTGRFAEHLAARPDQDLAAVASTLRRGRRVHRHRAVVVADDPAGAGAALGSTGRVRTATAPATPAPVAFLFSGQGAQHAGMGAGLYATEPTYRAAVDECAGRLRSPLGLDLRDLLLAPVGDAAADAALTRTALAQPALFAVEYALSRMWAAWGVEPGALLGHSVGEYVAATLAGVFSLPDALRLVAARGALMQGLPGGAMLAVAAAEDFLADVLPRGVAIAAVNGPRACVVSGPRDAIESFGGRLARQDVPVTPLRTSHAFHSPMMEPILTRFRAEVAAVARNAPTLPVLSNLTGDWATADQLTDPDYWVRHLRETVRFSAGLTTLLADGDRTLLEIGPGRQLAGLARAHLPAGSPALTSLPAPAEPADDRTTALSAAGRLWLAGVPVDVDAGLPAGPRVPLPTYPFDRRRFWVEPTTAPTGSRATGRPAAPDAGALAPDDRFAVPVWRQLGPVPGVRPSGSVRVLGAGPAAAEVVALLVAGGATAVLGDPADLGFVTSGEPLPDRIVHLAAWTAAPTGPDPDAAWAAQDTGFFSVLALAQALAAAQPAAPLRLDVVSAGTQAVVGADLTAPEHATLAGPVLVLPLELPWLSAHQLDLPAGPPDAGALVAELMRPAPEDAWIVAVRGGRRWVRDWTRTAAPALPADLDIDSNTDPVRPGAVCLITGGLGGIGITVAEQLAAREGARLVLLSRTPLPDRSTWDDRPGDGDRTGRAIAAIRRMEGVGAEVLVVAADVTDTAALGRVREQVLDRFGSLDVIVHAAGVAGGGMAEIKSRAQAEAVLAAKVRGTLALAAAFGDLALDAVVLCASVTGYAGGFGQVDYCGANAFLDAVAQSGAAFAGRTVAIDWGAWLEVGMAAETEAPSAFRALQRGVTTTPLAHPLLTAVHRDATDGSVTCTGTVGPGTHWVLDDHRLAGRAVLPGTGHIAAVVAAARAALGDTGPVEVRDMLLVEPLAVADDSTAELRVHLVPDGPGAFTVEVSSSAGGAHRTHARGSVAAAHPGPAPVHDLAAVLGRCGLETVEGNHTVSNSRLFTFGPHWTGLRRLHAGHDEELARLDAAPEVVAELAVWGLHPALLDEATAFVSRRVSGKFLPMGYGRILVRRALPATFWSHLRVRPGGSPDTLVADVVLIDDHGTELVAITEYMLRRIDADTVAAGVAAPAPIVSAPAVAGPPPVGIAPVEGVDALRRVLAADLGPQVSVSAVGVEAVLAGVRALTQEALEEDLTGATGSRPERILEGDYTAPGTELERALCRRWADVLGLDRVGVHDDFFEAGGNSLVAIQLIAGIREETGVRVPMRALFEAATVARMAVEITGLRADPVAAEPPPAPQARGAR